MSKLFGDISSVFKAKNKSFAVQAELKSVLSKIAPSISERAVIFVNILFQMQNIEEVELFNWTYNIPHPTKSPICSKVKDEKKEEVFYKCYNCAKDSFSCLCKDCFSAGDHKGHNYVQIEEKSGCCDCGDIEHWSEEGFCPNHSSKIAKL